MPLIAPPHMVYGCLHLYRSFGGPGAQRHLTHNRTQPQSGSRCAFGAYVRRCPPRKRKGATRMASKLCSAERIVLECGSCGERTVLGGPEDVWLSGRPTFECECGRGLTLADRLGEARP